jgi:TetR/AcrR family transcriptional regulator, ethionamide resistance regulator
MAGRRGRPAADRTRVRAELARQVLLAADREIATGEFADLSIERLTGAAGISRSKFYVYFQDKDDLIRAWFSEVRTEINALKDAWWALDAESTRDDLHEVITGIVTAYQPHRTLMAAVYDQALHNPAIREEVDALIEENTAQLAKHIRRGQREGFVDDGLLPNETAAWLTWMAERTQHALEPGASGKNLDRHIGTYTEIVWSTLYAPGRRS